ncbi:MAG: hypothetical protein AABZ55_05170 [Bdellovibrionota bacterium]
MKNNIIATRKPHFACLLIMTAFFTIVGCAGAPVKKQAYAGMPTQRTFENEFPEVWKGIETAFKNHRVSGRDPETVESLEMKNLKERSLKTDWVVARSRDKYQEYKVNSLPKKVYLQTRVRFEVIAKKVMGGTNVSVHMDEEIERLKEDGSSDGFSSVSELDTSRAGEILEKIQNSMLSAAP